jgi:hypothetical protein
MSKQCNSRRRISHVQWCLNNRSMDREREEIRNDSVRRDKTHTDKDVSSIPAQWIKVTHLNRMKVAICSTRVLLDSACMYCT